MSTKIKALPLRSEVPTELTWDLSTVYADEATWEADLARVATYPEKIAAFKGRLGTSGTVLLEYLRLKEECIQLFSKLALYARLRQNEDESVSHYKALLGRCSQIGTKISAAGSFFHPEFLAIKPEVLKEFVATTPGLELYQHDFDELDRERSHSRSEEVEELLALSGEAAGGPAKIFGCLDNVDLPLPEIDGENGEKIQLTNGNWATLLDCPNRQVRHNAFLAMFTTFQKLRNTFAATYAAQVDQDIFRARARKYQSCIEKALSEINVPVSVYDTLISTVHANLPLLQRYLELRKRVLGVEQLEWYDLYVPMVAGVDNKIEYGAACEEVLAAVAPLGTDYVETLRQGFKSRWVDVVENKHKRSGAFSSGTWGTNPFMLLNWQGDIDSTFTLAHEAGHSMHSHYSKSNQPYTYSGYTLFVAEVASTTNEALLARHLLKKATDPKMRLYIINQQLEGIRQTLVRQTMFAEFERAAHASKEAGTPLTPDSLHAIHKGLNEKYYGSVVRIDDLLGNEWARIPHFYRAFYVYQYATGISAATALARGIVTEGQPAVDRYLAFLKSGSSDYSINLLQKAGVDLSTPAPIQAAFDAFAEYLTMFETEYAALQAAEAAAKAAPAAVAVNDATESAAAETTTTPTTAEPAAPAAATSTPATTETPEPATPAAGTSPTTGS